MWLSEGPGAQGSIAKPGGRADEGAAGRAAERRPRAQSRGPQPAPVLREISSARRRSDRRGGRARGGERATAQVGEAAGGAGRPDVPSWHEHWPAGWREGDRAGLTPACGLPGPAGAAAANAVATPRGRPLAQASRCPRHRAGTASAVSRARRGVGRHARRSAGSSRSARARRGGDERGPPRPSDGEGRRPGRRGRARGPGAGGTGPRVRAWAARRGSALEVADALTRRRRLRLARWRAQRRRTGAARRASSSGRPARGRPRTGSARALRPARSRRGRVRPRAARAGASRARACSAVPAVAAGRRARRRRPPAARGGAAGRRPARRPGAADGSVLDGGPLDTVLRRSSASAGPTLADAAAAGRVAPDGAVTAEVVALCCRSR